MRIDDTSDLIPEEVEVHFADVEIHVFRVPAAPVKEAEVAASLQDKSSFICSAAELGEEKKMKSLDERDRTSGSHAL